MAAMIRVERLAREQGGELRLAGCSRDVQHTLELVRLDSMFALFPSLPAAVAPTAPPAPKPVEQIVAANP
jgi:anti-anti-sigma regulatory factor